MAFGGIFVRLIQVETLSEFRANIVLSGKSLPPLSP